MGVPPNTNAWAEALERLRPRLKWFFLSRVKDPEEAEELTQQVLVKAWENRSSLSEWNKLDQWVFSIAKNVLMDFYRHRSLLVEDDDLYLIIDPSTADLETSLDLNKAMDSLPEHMRQVIQLRFYQGLSVNETAVAMGKTPMAIKLLQFRALKALRDILKP